MQRKLTISIDEKVYKGLYKVVGSGKISRFIEDLLRPHVVSKELEKAYQEMSRDKNREEEARQWSESHMRDVSDESW